MGVGKMNICASNEQYHPPTSPSPRTLYATTEAAGKDNGLKWKNMTKN
jgi:hypothetical protein